MRRPKLRFARGAWRAVFFETSPTGAHEHMVTLKNAKGELFRTEKDRQRAMKAMLDLQAAQGVRARNEARITVAVLFERFLLARGPSIRPSSVDVYQRALNLFASEYGLLRAEDITPHIIETWKGKLGKTLSPATVNTRLRPLRACFRWALDTSVLEESPFRGVKEIRIPRGSGPSVITWEEFRRDYLPGLSSPRTRAAVCLAIFAGLRMGEVVNLKWSDVDLDAGSIRVQSSADWETKSGKPRMVPIMPELLSVLQAVPKAGRWVVGVKRPTSNHIGECWRAVSHGLTFHALRASYATEMLRRLPPAVVQVLLGHADINTTMRYYAAIDTGMAYQAARDLFPVLFPES